MAASRPNVYEDLEISAPSPGRPRSFDLNSVLDATVDLFWEQGYRSTTTRDLERHLGIGQSSLTHNFGTKRDLLLAAIDRYETRMETDLFPILEDSHGLTALDAFFETLGDWLVANNLRGCLVVNLMASEARDPVIGSRVQAYRNRIRSSFRKPLEQASRAHAGPRAELLTAAVLGLHLTARSTDQKTEIRAMISAIRNQIEQWS